MSYGYNDYGYGYDVGGMLSSLLIFVLVFSCIALVFAVLMIIGQWKCFKKAGYKGWECLIAGHSQFVNCTFAGVNPILILGLMFGSVVTIIPILGFLVYLGFLIYYQIIVGINTAKAFGKGTGFGVALAIPLSAPIAWFILGKDDIKYVGVPSNNNVEQNAQSNYQQPMQQSMYNEPQNTVVEPTVVTPIVQPVVEQPQPTQSLNCSRCGAPVNPGDKFCMSCGNQL